MATYRVTFRDREPMLINYAYDRDNAIQKAINYKPKSYGDTTRTSARRSITSCKKVNN